MTVDAATPPRPQAAAPKGWGTVAAVFVTILVLTLGGWVVAGAVPGDPELVTAGASPDRIQVGPNLSVPLAPGWSVVQSGPGAGGAVLSGGTGLLEIYPAGIPYTDPATLLGDYLAQSLRPAASQLSVGPSAPFPGLAGASAVRASYQGTFPIAAHPLEGAVTAVVAPSGTAVIFDGSAPLGQLLTVLDEVDAMIAGSEIR